MRTGIRRGTLIVAAALGALGLAAVDSESGSRGRQLVITGVQASLEDQELTIHGRNFDGCRNLRVRLGEAELVVLSATSDTVVADASGALLESGEYLLRVSAGRAGRCNDRHPLTVGAAGTAGETGPPGPDGIPGAEGPAGPKGPIGPQGTSGPPGLVGPAGAAGPAGAQGESGATVPVNTWNASVSAEVGFGYVVAPRTVVYYGECPCGQVLGSMLAAPTSATALLGIFNIEKVQTVRKVTCGTEERNAAVWKVTIQNYIPAPVSFVAGYACFGKSPWS